MRNRKKEWAVLLVSLLLILSGCQAAPTENNAAGGLSGMENTNTGSKAGRYVETDITPDGEEKLHIVQFFDGKLSMFTAGLKTRFDSTDNGESWVKAEGPGAKVPELAGAYDIFVGKDGALLVPIMDDEGTFICLKKVFPDGTVEDFAVPDIDRLVQKGNFFAHEIIGLSEDKFFFSGTKYLASQDQSMPDNEENSAQAEGESVNSDDSYEPITAVFDTKTGEKLYDIPQEENAISKDASGEHFYFINVLQQIVKRSAQDGKEVQRTDMMQQESDSVMVDISLYSSLPNGTLYSADDKGIYLVDTSTGKKKMVLESIGYSLGETNNYMSGFIAVDNGGFIVQTEFVQDSHSSSRIYRYHYDENAKTDPDKELTIWSLKSNTIIRGAVNEFMKTHPDATVNLEVALGEDSAQTTNDAIQRLNTEILAGAGPDILILDGLPAESYIQKGMLADISDKLDFSDVYPEILTPMKTEDSLYYLPACYKATLLLSDAETLAQLDTLDKLVTAIEEGEDAPVVVIDGEGSLTALPEEQRPVIEFENFEEMFRCFWNNSAHAVVGQGEIQEDNLREFLSKIKWVSDKYRLAEEGENVAMIIPGDTETESNSNAMNYAMRRAKTGIYTINNLLYLAMFLEDGQYKLLPGLAPGSYRPVSMAGINAKSGAQDFAVEFLQSMLSTKTQAAVDTGFPITKSGFAAQLEGVKKFNVDRVNEEDKLPEDFEIETILKELRTPVFEDEYLSDTVYAAAKSLCKDEIDLDGAMREIQQEIKIYLAERA